jgi:hypothetical protein
VSTKEQTLNLTVEARDTEHRLRQINVAVNGVPLFGSEGYRAHAGPVERWLEPIAVPLSAGANRVQISVLNNFGTESRRATVNIDSAAARKAPPDIYVVVVGVSLYKDERYQLNYAAKDALDLSAFWKTMEDKQFSKVHVMELVDANATRDKILAAHKFLLPAQVDDEVVIFFAGHGLRAAGQKYFFGTVDVDFSHPADQGLPYEAIEGLLDGVQARKRLVLLDTCFAGEQVYQAKGHAMRFEGIEDTSYGASEGPVVTDGALMPGVTARAIPKPRGQIITARALISSAEDPMFLLQSLFVDLRRGSGAEIIAAAGGEQLAYEGLHGKNGTFTAAVLEGLRGEAARAHANTVTASELLDYVTKRVLQLTGGRQRPLARERNLSFDFPLY